jgi:hypothetical protein
VARVLAVDLRGATEYATTSTPSVESESELALLTSVPGSTLTEDAVVEEVVVVAWVTVVEEEEEESPEEEADKEAEALEAASWRSFVRSRAARLGS